MAAPSGPAGQGLWHPTASLGQGLTVTAWTDVGSWAVGSSGGGPQVRLGRDSKTC